MITGVREDVLETLLNLKGIVFRSKKDCKHGRSKIQGPAVVTEHLIDFHSDLEVANPNHSIATIVTNDFLGIELKIEHGTGHKLVGQTLQDSSKHFLRTDAIFMWCPFSTFSSSKSTSNESIKALLCWKKTKETCF